MRLVNMATDSASLPMHALDLLNVQVPTTLPCGKDLKSTQVNINAA